MLSLSFFLLCLSPFLSFFFFFNDTATTEIYTLSLHDALPICPNLAMRGMPEFEASCCQYRSSPISPDELRSEEHTSELQSPDHLVCRLLLEKKKKKRDKERCVLEIILQHVIRVLAWC